MESVMNYIFLNKYFKTLLFLLNGVKLPFGYYKKNIHLRLQSESTVESIIFPSFTASKDGTIRLWDVVLGLHVAMIDMHHPVLSCSMSENCCRFVVHLENCKRVPLLCLHNCPEPTNSSTSEPNFSYTNRNEGMFQHF